MRVMAASAATRTPPERPAVIAHRGSSAARPEHTLGAFRQAIVDGADGIECDVRMTRDGELVCLHDRSADRTSEGRGLVSRHTLEQLRALDWSRGAPSAPRDGVALEDRALVTLAELATLVRAAARPVGLVVEVKHPSRFGARVDAEVVRVLARAGLLADDAGAGGVGRRLPAPATVLSFWPTSLRRIGLHAPSLERGQLVAAATPGLWRARLADGVAVAGLDLALVRRRPELVARHQARGHRVFVWTVDGEADLRRCHHLGVDAVITNHPARALAVFDARG